ncbi:MAG: hypothetical protein R3232_09745 [Clostridia bacterium]|nr:hypothetical protein [Clostridia bacterium]
MKVIKYPEDISKQEFLDNYAERVLKCLKSGLASSYPQVNTPGGDVPWYEWLNIYLDKGVRYIILEDDGIRGYLVWFYEGDEVQIYDLAILPEYQMDAITLRRLLAEFINDIRKYNFKSMIAYTNLKNKRMNGILRKRGFKVVKVKERGTLYRIDIDKLFQRLRLSE